MRGINGKIGVFNGKMRTRGQNNEKTKSVRKKTVKRAKPTAKPRTAAKKTTKAVKKK